MMDKIMSSISNRLHKAYDSLKEGDQKRAEIIIYDLINGYSDPNIKERFPNLLFPQLYSKRGFERKKLKRINTLYLERLKDKSDV